MMKKLLLLTSALMFAATAWSQNNLLPYCKVYDVKAKTTVVIESIIRAAENADVIFFGEEHSDSIAHFLQDTLYKALINHYGDVTLSMEMFERDCQLVVDEYLKGFITESLLIKEGRAWKNYKDYRNPVNTAKQKKQVVVAANAPRRYVNMVNRNGIESLSALDKESKKYLAPLPMDTVNVPYFKKFYDAMGGKGHFSSRKTYYAQTVWDATMAYSIYKTWGKDKQTKIFQLNGRFHSDERLGIVTHLQKKNKKLRIITISCFAAEDFQKPDWSNYEVLADFVILTDPGVPKTF